MTQTYISEGRFFARPRFAVRKSDLTRYDFAFFATRAFRTRNLRTWDRAVAEIAIEKTAEIRDFVISTESEPQILGIWNSRFQGMENRSLGIWFPDSRIWSQILENPVTDSPESEKLFQSFSFFAAPYKVPRKSYKFLAKLKIYNLW